MKFVRNTISVLLLTILICGTSTLIYYSNEYMFSFTDIEINESEPNSYNNTEIAELFKRVLRTAEETTDLSVIEFKEPQLSILTHTNGKNQRTYSIYITSIMTRSAYIYDTKTEKLYKMTPSAFTVFLQKDEIKSYVYSFSEPCQLTISKNETKIAGTATQYDWNYITADGSYVKVRDNTSESATPAKFSGEPEDFQITLPYGSSSLKARIYTDTEEILFEGDLVDGILPKINEDGNFRCEITAVWNADVTKDFYGTAKYIFIIENDVPVSITAEKISVYQGEFIRLFAENASVEDTFSVTCPELSYTSTFFPSEKASIALLPIPCETTPGIYTLTVKENEKTRSLEIEVKEQSFDIATTIINTEVSAAAKSEFEQFLEPLQHYISQTDYSGTTFSTPVDGKITTSFGTTLNTNTGAFSSIHNGLDISATGNPRIKASQNGTVVFVGELEISGKTVAIDHGMNILSYYYHLKTTDVSVNQTVYKGDIIGTMGSTGVSSGDHLHYTVMINGIPTNPMTLYDVNPCAEKIK